jgi:hypothetical protein
MSNSVRARHDKTRAPNFLWKCGEDGGSLLSVKQSALVALKGSNPFASTILFSAHSWGVAQSVQHLTVNQAVRKHITGSSPVAPAVSRNNFTGSSSSDRTLDCLSKNGSLILLGPAISAGCKCYGSTSGSNPAREGSIPSRPAKIL